ncbi:eukaryotic translation initiation factor 3 subunit K [Strongylocentrotus purpuratus]|uniref:Eukaryotic translation initiation factor 3 subunit K n=1 Tax=Strongylocentrotus purpuratus TaxID=7668 RepID=A0A7M7PTK1_STRPU|nr:eukaryotic translation initiation factor 3 subunit K [Strongylocentrotus purpuratus]|eukprot:XP_011673866.1 PREDICTED: eukaryotic translation initiation factor 3 subunit K isoform X1 [Strongylocentrotus purpuratus]
MAFEQAQATVSSMLHGINRYNPENLALLENYVEIQGRENQYDLEANLAILKLYQLNPSHFKMPIAALIFLKAMTNLPHTDIILCKCLLDSDVQQEEPLASICYFAGLLETCQFKEFWTKYESRTTALQTVAGFHNAIRKFICHVINSTYQTIEKVQLGELLGVSDDTELKRWMANYDWKELDGGKVFISNQEESVKTKNITEKIGFDNVATVMKISQ